MSLLLHHSVVAGKQENNVFGNGIQPAPSLVLGHNYENNGDDVAGNFPLIVQNGSAAYANNWSAQGLGLTNFNVGGLQYSVNSNINTTFETGTFTAAWHLRTGNVLSGGYNLIGDASVNEGVLIRILNDSVIQFIASNTPPQTNVTVNQAGLLQPSTNYHLACVRSSSFMKIYLNAIEKANTNHFSNPVSTGGTAQKIGNNLPSDWELYDYGVWDIAMTAGQVNNIMNNQAP